MHGLVKPKNNICLIVDLKFLSEDHDCGMKPPIKGKKEEELYTVFKNWVKLKFLDTKNEHLMFQKWKKIYTFFYVNVVLKIHNNITSHTFSY